MRPVPLLLWLGQVLSLAGDRLYVMAMLWLTLEMTGSTTAMAAVSLSESIPLALMGLVGGVLVDRWDRLRTLIAVDLLRALLVLMVPVAYYLGAMHPWVLMTVGVGMGALGALFDPAMQATLPALVSKEEFPALAGLMDTPARLARLLGPGLAGPLLVLLPTVQFFTLDAVSFLLSAAGLMLVIRRTGWKPAQASQVSKPPLRASLADGWQAVKANRPLLTILTMDALGNVAWPAYSLGGMLLATEKLGSDMAGYGLLIAAYGLGSMIGNVLAGNLDLRAWWPAISVGGWIGIGAGFALMGLAPSMPLAIASIALAGACGSMSHVSRAAYIGQTMDSHHLGKVHSFKNILTTCAGAAGTLLVGWALDRFPADAVIGTAGVALMGISAALLVVMRRARAGMVHACILEING